VVGLRLETTPMWDFGTLFDSAIEWLNTGKLVKHRQYFSMLFQQTGAVILLRYVFGLARLLGFDNFYAVGVALNAFFISSTFLLIYLICRKLFGIQSAFIALFACVLYLPLLFNSAVFYTDTLSMPFITLCYFIYLNAKSTKSWKKVVLFFILGIVCAVGALIKFNVTIIGIAIIVEFLITTKNSWIKWLSVISMIIAFMALVYGINVRFTNSMLSKKLVEQNRYPITTWVMMGLQGDGTYHANDLSYVYQFDTYHEKQQAVNTEIKNRIESLGVAGLLKLLYKKSMVSFGDGTLNPLLDNRPINNSFLHEFVLKDGNYYSIYFGFIQGYYISILFFMILSAYNSLKNHRHFEIIVPRLSILGQYIFLMLWESDARYITNYIPIMILCATMFVAAIFNINEEKKDKYEMIQ